ncbi:MAG: PAS domain S-box protein [Chloroflexi bacterium]|nr:PAS domain S-box protein [Chloroflexota bacterium]
MEVDIEAPLPSGSRWYHSDLQPVKDPSGKVIAIQCISYDITERKQAEERVEHLNLILRSIRDVNQLIVTEKDPDKLIKRACDKLTQTRGYQTAWIALLDRSGIPVASAESGFGSDFAEIEEQLKRCKLPKCVKTALMQPDVLAIEDRSKICRSCPLWKMGEGLGVMCTRLEHDRHAYGVICVNLPTHMTADTEEQSLFVELASDIALAIHSIEEERERRLAEQVVREREEEYSTLVELCPDGIVVTKDTEIVFMNQRAGEIVGRAITECIGKDLTEFVAANTPELMEELQNGFTFEDISKISTDNIGFRTFTLPIRKGTGELVWLETSRGPIVYKGENVQLSFIRDITERKQAEEALRESEERWRSLVENAPNQIISVDREGTILFLNRTVSPDLVPDDLIDTSILDFALPGERDRTQEAIETVFNTGESVGEFEIQGYNTLGTIRWYSWRAGPVRLGSEVVAATIIVTDINERKLAEQELRESEAFNFALFQYNATPTIIADLEGRVVKGNLAQRYSDNRIPEIGDMMYEDYAGKHDIDMHAELMECIRSGKPKQFPEQKYDDRYLFITISPFSQGAMIMANDVTEIKQSEEALRESEEKYRLLIDNYSDPILVYDRDNVVLVMNVAAAVNLGGEPKDFIGKSVYDFLPKSAGFTVERHRQIIESGKRADFEDLIELPSGDNRWFWSTLQPTRGQDGSNTCIQVISYDITERKLAEEALKESEAKYSAVVQKANEGIAVVHNDRIVFANEALSKITGYSVSELEGKALSDVMTTESAEHAMEIYRKRMSGEPVPSVYEVRALRKDGSTRDVEISAGTIPYLGNVASIAVIRDITGRKETEQALKESEEKYRLLIENYTDPIIIYDRDSRVTIINSAAAQDLGGAREDFIGMSIQEFLPTVASNVIQRNLQIIESGAGASFEDIIELHTGEQRWFWSNLQPVKDVYGHITGVQVISYDITERKKAEEALRESEEKYRTLMESFDHPIWGFDCNGIALVANLAATKPFGKKPEDYIGRSITEYAPERSAMILDRNRQVIESGIGASFEDAFEFPRGRMWFWSSLHPVKDADGNITGVQAISYDITERKQAEEALRESEEKWRSLIDNSNDIIQILDIEGNILYMNKVYPSHTLENVIGRPVFEFMDDKSRQITRDSIGRLLKEKTPQDLEVVILLPGHGDVHFDVKYVPMFVNGEVDKIISLVSDIEEKKESEEKLRKSEERLRQLSESTFEAIVVHDKGNLLLDNDQFYEMFGRKPGESFSIEEALTPESLAEITERFGSDDPGPYELTGVRIDGTRFPLEVRAREMEFGGVMARAAAIRDITERKRAEKELREGEEKLRTMFDAIGDAVHVTDLEGNIIEVNQSSLAIFGYESKDEILGSHAAELIDKKDHAKLANHIAMTLETGRGEVQEYLMRGINGREFSGETHANLLRDGSGNPTGFISITRDVTERKKAEEEAARAKGLEELDVLRTALLASVSHELRTPLTSIKGLASTLVQPDVEWDKETQEDFLNSIVRESDRLNHIVSDLLDMSRLESGTMTMRKTECTLSSVVREISDQLNVLVANNRLKINVPADLPEIYADEIRIGEVITNLVSNAVSYSEDDTEITLQAKQHDNEILVSVTDQGIGIAVEHLDKVFDRFYRLEGGTIRRRGGSGLGLAICRGIVEAHDGRIWVESIGSEGSKFNVSLPIVATSEVNFEQNVSTKMDDQDISRPDVSSSTSLGGIRE